MIETLVEKTDIYSEGEVPLQPFDEEKVYRLPMSSVLADEEWNCRGFIDPTNVLELANSIRPPGRLHQPVIVMPNPDPGRPFKLVAGYRRYKAHQILKAKSIACLIHLGMDENDARLLNLTENLQRAELNIKQEAHAIARLRNMTEQSIADRVKKSRGWVQVRLMLLMLPEDVQDEAAAGVLTSAQIRTCAGLIRNSDADPTLVYSYVKRIKDSKLRGNKRQPKPKDTERARQSHLRSAEEIGEIQDLIRETIGNNFATKMLGWAAGFVTPLDAHKALKVEAERLGKRYEIPEELL